MSGDDLAREVEEARGVLARRLGGRSPAIGLLLGSGLSVGGLPLEDAVEVAAAEIPHLPRPSVAGHGASWTLGRLGGVEVIAAGGRVHAYEGIPLPRATLAIRLMAALGCRALVATNAAGGIREDLAPGRLMRIRDHLNLLGGSPLVGIGEERPGERFVDLTEAYDAAWGRRVLTGGSAAGIDLAEGVYAACLGPQYETPAEVRMLERLGADAVGMSTVPEVIVARHAGLRVFGLSLISNRAAGLSATPLSHEEVLAAGEAATADLERLLPIIVAEAL